MSLSVQILDLHDDLGGAQLKEIVASAPEFVKTAQIASRDEVARLPVECFALHALTKEGADLRKYPVHTKADTWLSCAYFEKNAHKLPIQAARIAATHLKTACAKFELPTEYRVSMFHGTADSNRYIEENDCMRKVASESQLVDRPDEGRYALAGRYPLFHESHVKKAASYFEEHFRHFDSGDRHEFASNVLARASELQMPLDGLEALQKVAGAEYGDRVAGQISMRHKLVDGDVEAVIALEKISMVRNDLEAKKFATLLAAWDSENGMERLYGTQIVDPYQATFESLSKEAGYVWEDSSSGESLTGKELEKAASEKYDKIKGYFGETLANSLKKHGSQIFDSLPRDAKTVIAKIAKGGI